MNDRIKLAIAGAGHRSIAYADHAHRHPEKVVISAIAEPNDFRRKTVGDRYGVPEANRFLSTADMMGKGLSLDGVINGTMDLVHHQTAMEILEAGCNMLLEKPICTRKDHLLEIYRKATQMNAKVMVCHVLRYAPFYSTIKSLIDAGEIGDVVSVHTDEHVSYHHMTVGYIRGKWENSRECGSTILMAKCCHDLDILTWMKGKRPVKVASFGSLYQFRPEMAPEGAGTRCALDCSIERECPFSAIRHYIERTLWDMYAWAPIEEYADRDTRERKLLSLQTDNPYGRCVYACNNDMLDNQSVIVGFEDGTASSHNLVASTSTLARNIFVRGTRGDISGKLEESKVCLRKYNPSVDKLFDEEILEIPGGRDGHGGGDERMMEDFVDVLSGKPPSLSTTQLSDSIYGHLIGLQAQEALENNCTATIERID
ncbi:MAG: Gfo/Idh/MocA family oxidoreductase [Clostridia bacterium]